jgi:hypothetical protein
LSQPGINGLVLIIEVQLVRIRILTNSSYPLKSSVSIYGTVACELYGLAATLLFSRFRTDGAAISLAVEGKIWPFWIP